ncbi:MAG: DUF1353 domain-containing protein [Aliarcobacter sp.]|nr:DUF1353 domain-containing protein [Aliarcobacter sp.]
MIITYPTLQPTKTNKFVLTEEYRYKCIKIPIGYETNGADIPRPFGLIIQPFSPKYLPAILVHDFLIEKATNSFDICIANEYFEEMLLIIEDSYKTKIMIIAVKLYWKFKIKFKKGKK